MLEDYPDLLTRKQAQELLHMGKNRILNHIHSGRLRALILDGRYLIKKRISSISSHACLTDKH